MAHEHIVVDTDNRFIIDENTREISLSTGYATVMQYDHNSERITFELPKMVDGHDMTQCNEVQVHYININASTKETNAGVYDVTDLAVSEDDPEKVTLSWLISQNATQYAGVLNFVVKFKCIADDGTVEYSWSSAIYKGMTVASGLDIGNTVAEEYSDILAAWEARIQALEEGGGGADWNAKEGEPGHVLNRTHYTESGRVEVLAETTTTLIAESFNSIVIPACPVSVGDTIIVHWNETEYSCVGTDGAAVNMPGAAVVGNIGAMTGGVDTGEPFVIALGEDEGQCYVVVVPVYGSTEVTLSIYGEGETVHKLDPKYLPASVPHVEIGGRVEILPMTEAVGEAGGEWFITSKIEGVEVGNSYIVNYNGTEYTCVGQDFSMIPGAVALGDVGALTGEDSTGEPFVLLVVPDAMFEQMGVGAQVVPIDGAETISISVSALSETLYKIDPRLLPDDLVKDVLIVKVATTDSDLNPVTASYTGLDIEEACLFFNKAALFAHEGKTLPLITVSDEEVTAEFGNIYFSNGSLLRDYVVIDRDGNITTYEIGETVTLNAT